MSLSAALHASGAVIFATDLVMRKLADNAFCCIRPPGHHAGRANSAGFCIFNHVAAGVAHAFEKYGIKRAAIIDFDVHHGNGTEEAFENDPRVLYISMHQYPLFPGTGRINDKDNITHGGAAIDIPLPAGCGDNEYKQVFDEIVVPAAQKFKPELVLVSAGYDGHWADDISNIRMTLDGYYNITRIIQQLSDELCGGRSVFCLEGGYNFKVLSCAINGTFYIWLGENNFDDPFGPPPHDLTPQGVNEVIREVKRLHGLV